jgi:hypothetical protein
VNGRVLWSDTTCLSTAEGRRDWLSHAAPRTSIATNELEAALLDLAALVELTVRGLPVVEWGPLVPLSESLPALPFPVRSLLAPTLVNFVLACADAYRVPHDFAAAGVLGALSGAVAQRQQLHLGGELYASGCLWIAAVGRSGSGKTPPIKRALRPLRQLQDQAIARHQERMEDFKADLAEWERAKPADRDARPEAPALARVLISDATVESLSVDLRNAPAGVLLVRDELAAWLSGFDKYRSGTGGSDRAAWLEIWSHETIDISRKSGEDRLIYVKRPYVAVVGGVQPKRYHELMGNQDDGMGARILLCYPDAPIAAIPDASIDPEVEDAYCQLIITLQALPYDEETPAVSLLRDARRRYRELDASFKREWTPDVSPRLDEALSKLTIYAAG